MFRFLETDLDDCIVISVKSTDFNILPRNNVEDTKVCDQRWEKRSVDLAAIRM